jgi:hypothetical protein
LSHLFYCQQPFGLQQHQYNMTFIMNSSCLILIFIFYSITSFAGEYRQYLLLCDVHGVVVSLLWSSFILCSTHWLNVYRKHSIKAHLGKEKFGAKIFDKQIPPKYRTEWERIPQTSRCFRSS